MGTKRKPQLAEDAITSRIVFPVWLQPKIDGVRGMNLEGTFTGRSLDPFEGFGVTEYFSTPTFQGLDGEITLGDSPTIDNPEESLCAKTTGALGRFKGVSEMADLHLWAFDLVTDETVGLPYEERYAQLEGRVKAANHPRLHLVPYEVVSNAEELAEVVARHLAAGYEGTIVRNPRAKYKEGRATQAGQELWRYKPWGDFEILVEELIEEETNTNAAKKNTLGRTERSSAKAGKVKNGSVGAIVGTIVADVCCPITGRVMFPKGKRIKAGSGKMKAAQAKAFFENPETIVGHYAKVKHLAYGVIEQPRMATFESLRLKQDMLGAP